MAGDEAETKACPWCAETILAAAKKCKHCGEFLEGAAPSTEPAAHSVAGVTDLLACPTCGVTAPLGDTAWLSAHIANLHASHDEDDYALDYSDSPAAPFDGSVWEFTGMRWKCLAHGKGICVKCGRLAKMPSKKGTKGQRVPPPSSGLLVCPQCQTRGQVKLQLVKQKKGISGGKATGAVLTGGLSILATGLSRKEEVTEAHCNACGSTWHFA
jgi:hypothetical protein